MENMSAVFEAFAIQVSSIIIKLQLSNFLCNFFCKKSVITLLLLLQSWMLGRFLLWSSVKGRLLHSCDQMSITLLIFNCFAECKICGARIVAKGRERVDWHCSCP